MTDADRLARLETALLALGEAVRHSVDPQHAREFDAALAPLRPAPAPTGMRWSAEADQAYSSATPVGGDSEVAAARVMLRQWAAGLVQGTDVVAIPGYGWMSTATLTAFVNAACGGEP